MIDQAEELRKLKGDTNKLEANSKTKNSIVITISSGKGGVGKSNCTANLAIEFAKLGKKVVIIDADFGLANIEVLFGALPQKNLLNVLRNEVSIEDALTDGPLGIKFLSGGSGIKELTNLKAREQLQLLNSFSYIDEIFDIILIDNGAGASDLVINFINASDRAIIVTTPEPTSITDAYALIKIIKNELDDRDIDLIINRVNNENEGEEAYNKLKTVAKQFLDINLNYLGELSNDKHLMESVMKQKPVSILYPDTEYTNNIKLIANKLLGEETNKDTENTEVGGLSFAKKILGMFRKK